MFAGDKNGIIIIGFPDLSATDASTLAKELYQELTLGGMTADQIELKPASENAQDLGSLLFVAVRSGLGSELIELTTDPGKEFLKGAFNRAFQQTLNTLWHKLRRWSSRAKIDDSSKGVRRRTLSTLLHKLRTWDTRATVSDESGDVLFILREGNTQPTASCPAAQMPDDLKTSGMAELPAPVRALPQSDTVTGDASRSIRAASETPARTYRNAHPRIAAAAEAWRDVKNRDSIEDLKLYADQFPDTFWAKLANKRVAELEKDQANAEAKRKWAEAERAELLHMIAITFARDNLLQLWSRAPQDVAARLKSLGFVNVQSREGGESGFWLKPGESFRESIAPEMVVIPAGKVMVGSPDGEKDRDHNEGPQHQVTIRAPFALGRFSVTLEEFGAFVEETGHDMPDEMHTFENDNWELRKGRSFRNPGFEQSPRHPVVGVSWHDAVAYCQWLSKKTGKIYRLPSEAEWEYACRAGTKTPFWWGPSISTDNANYDGRSTYGGGIKGRWRKATVPVDTFKPNPWGLYQFHGNVWEWCADNWHGNYREAPEDGSVWQDREQARRVLRGGSWFNVPKDLRTATRYGFNSKDRYFYIGFRVARHLSP